MYVPLSRSNITWCSFLGGCAEQKGGQGWG